MEAQTVPMKRAVTSFTTCSSQPGKGNAGPLWSGEQNSGPGRSPSSWGGSQVLTWGQQVICSLARAQGVEPGLHI